MSTDAITVLKADHKEVARLFAEFEKKATTPARKEQIVRKVIELLTVHTYIENEILYPEARERVPDLEQHILESYEEHHVVDLLATELDAMTREDERFEAKFTVLIENVRHHVKEEEDEWFPKLRDALGRSQLSEMGARMLELKKTAPTGPSQPSALKKAIDAVVS
ncbi:MAG: hemerythrin domain-containing protein [Tetrasphaera sp.]|nr:hemerythrin domain-containing protein [Tetrasphaera sp.]